MVKCLLNVNIRLAALGLMAVLSACSTISTDTTKTYEAHIPVSTETPLGQVYTEWGALHDTDSGFIPLTDGLAAFGARLRLIEAAVQSIDMQYFLMKPDDAGSIIAGSLLEAADRGVRIRILLDDVFTSVQDDELGLLDQHENIQVRLFNPVSRRGLYYLNYAADFKRANRRMHSKSFTVDSAATIVGGRNIADEYFQINSTVEFVDFDIFTIGPVVQEVADQFDDFWNAPEAIPLANIYQAFSASELLEAKRDIDEDMQNRERSIYSAAVNSEFMRSVADGTATTYSAPAELLNDGSDKLSNPIDEQYMTVVAALAEKIAAAEKSVVIVTPYFVPRKKGIEFWKSVTERGVEVTVITNSLASNNHLPVHSAYSAYRKQMLELGAKIYEARASAIEQMADSNDTEALTLHTKLISIDSRYLFVGSLNLDPRSIEINAEMGLLIDSQEMGAMLQQNLYEDLANSTYELSLNNDGKLMWRASVNGEVVESAKEPEASLWKRFMSRIYRILPESQL
jgi:putative cardiolipin synthase